MIVDDDVAPAGLDASCLDDRSVGADAGGQDDDVGVQDGAVGEGHDIVVVSVGDGLGGDARVDVNAEAAQLLRNQRRHLDLERRQDVLGELDEVGFETASGEGLGGLDADEAGTEHDGAGARGFAQGKGIVNRAQSVHARGVEAVDRRTGGERAG